MLGLRDARGLATLDPRSKNKLKKFLKGLFVRTTHLRSRGNTRHPGRPIKDLAHSAEEHMFNKDGVEMSVAVGFHEGYLQRYRSDFTRILDLLQQLL
jgi:hypothetical protein